MSVDRRIVYEVIESNETISGLVTSKWSSVCDTKCLRLVYRKCSSLEGNFVQGKQVLSASVVLIILSQKRAPVWILVISHTHTHTILIVFSRQTWVRWLTY